LNIISKTQHSHIRQIMNKKLKSYLVILGQLVIGLIILISTQQLSLPDWINNSAIVLLAFMLLNFSLSFLLKLNNELKSFWSIRKIHWLIVGIIGGALITFIPSAIGVITGQLNYSEITLNADISISAIGITFLIISWEELWFRGMFLNYCNRYLTSINLSLTIGFLFMLIHILNPNFDLLKTGPTLFFAGALLTLLYFYYKTIWLPLGIHFGNNFIGTVLNTQNDSDVLFRNEGYISATVLAVLFFMYLIKTKKLNDKNLKNESDQVFS